MDDESPLNIAHRHQRKAEALVKVGRFDEAIEHHAEAEKALSTVDTTSMLGTVFESLLHQRQYHVRQQSIIRHKQRHAEFIKTQQNNLKKITYNGLGDILSSPEHDYYKSNLVIQQAVRTIWAHDSLVNFVIHSAKRHWVNQDAMCKSLDSAANENVAAARSEKIRLEQLRSSNEELRRILLFLITEFEKVRSENKTLRSSLAELLLDPEKCLHAKDPIMQPKSTILTQISENNIDHVSEKPELVPVDD